MFLFSIPFTGGHIGYERERVAQQGFILLFFDFFSYFQMSFLFITGLIHIQEMTAETKIETSLEGIEHLSKEKK